MLDLFPPRPSKTLVRRRPLSSIPSASGRCVKSAGGFTPPRVKVELYGLEKQTSMSHNELPRELESLSPFVRSAVLEDLLESQAIAELGELP
jgi:hypothetical protein